jgi:hypothetical protein
MWLVEEDWPAEKERYQDDGLTLHIELRIKGDTVVRVHAADHMPSRRVSGAKVDRVLAGIPEMRSLRRSQLPIRTHKHRARLALMHNA